MSVEPFAGGVDPFPGGRAGKMLYYRRSIDTNPRADGYMLFNVEVNYAQAQPDKLSFQTGGGSQKVKYSLATLAQFYNPALDVGIGTIKATSAADFRVDFKQGLNVTKDNIEGVDIIIPQLVVKFTRSWLIEEMEDDYFDTLDTLTGTINSQPFTLQAGTVSRTWPKGEARFDGADTQVQSDSRIEIAYTFAISKGIYPGQPGTHQFVGPIKITDKPGWAYLWVSDETKVDDTGKVRVCIPNTVNIERVYYQADFGDLRLT